MNIETKASIIIILVMSALFGGIFGGGYWYSQTPDQLAQHKAYEIQSKWYDKQMALAHSTNDTNILKSIYRDAITHGADPDYAKHWWCCDSNDPTGVFKYAFAKYEALK